MTCHYLSFCSICWSDSPVPGPNIPDMKKRRRSHQRAAVWLWKRRSQWILGDFLLSAPLSVASGRIQELQSSYDSAGPWRLDTLLCFQEYLFSKASAANSGRIYEQQSGFEGVDTWKVQFRSRVGTFPSGRIDELQFDSDSSQLKVYGLNERQHHSKSW